MFSSFGIHNLVNFDLYPQRLDARFVRGSAAERVAVVEEDGAVYSEYVMPNVYAIDPPKPRPTCGDAAIRGPVDGHSMASNASQREEKPQRVLPQVPEDKLFLEYVISNTFVDASPEVSKDDATIRRHSWPMRSKASKEYVRRFADVLQESIGRRDHLRTVSQSALSQPVGWVDIPRGISGISTEMSAPVRLDSGLAPSRNPQQRSRRWNRQKTRQKSRRWTKRGPPQQSTEDVWTLLAKKAQSSI